MKDQESTEAADIESPADGETRIVEWVVIDKLNGEWVETGELYRWDSSTGGFRQVAPPPAEFADNADL